MKFYLVCSKSFKNNEIFNLESPHNRDNCLYPYFLLRKELQNNGSDIDTYDLFDKDLKEPYAFLFFDFPKNIEYFKKNHPNIDKFLFIYESPIKNKKNQILENYRYFKKVFTWNKDVVDNKKIFFLPYSQKISCPQEILDFKIKKLCSAIFGHKKDAGELENYSERIRAIRWFEKNHPEDFDLYGAGWDRFYFSGKLFPLNRLSFLTKLFKPFYPSYKGLSSSKKETYKNYKFSLCYENVSYKNYITEKIFDCFFAGCVPIYLGAPNIQDFIPRDTYIDRNEFKSTEELYSFIKNMDETTYNKYLSSIDKFLKGDSIYQFSAEYFSKNLSREMLN